MDVLKLLREYFPELIINEQIPPTYVKCFLDESSPNVIFVYKKGSNGVNITPRKRDYTITSEFDLTGSPLKLDMGYDKLEETFLMDISQCWLKEEITHEPLTCENARDVINFYNSKIQNFEKEDRIPLWVVCDGQDPKNTVLMAALTYKGNFKRGIVNHLYTMAASDLSIEKMKEYHWKTYGCTEKQPLSCSVKGTYRISGKRVSAVMHNNPDEVFSKHYTGMTQLECEWTKETLQVPIHEATINLVQETIIGHAMSNCTILWKSVTSLQGISNALLSISNTIMTPALGEISIRVLESPGPALSDLESRLLSLLAEVEEYGALQRGLKGGCICICDENTSLQQVFQQLKDHGSSNDFTFRLWDVIKDCDTVEDLITLLVYALKDVYKRNLRPFIDPGNTTFLGGLVKKLSRGVSQQAVASLSALHSRPSLALSAVGQLGITKLSWEYTNIFAAVDNTLAFNDRLKLINKVSEVNEAMYNQTVLEMTLGNADISINPFDTRCNLMDSTFLPDSNTATTNDLADISLDGFASLKKHNINPMSEKRVPEQDQPLFSDDVELHITSKEWKFKLTRFAQLQTCLEHICRTQQSLNSDFNTLKPIVSKLLDFYTADKSPIKTVGQLRSEPVQIFTVPVQYKTVKDHLQFKNASVYKVVLTSQSFRESKNMEEKLPYQTIQSVFVCSQQPIFPPSIFSNNDIPDDHESLFYNCTRCLYLSNTVC